MTAHGDEGDLQAALRIHHPEDVRALSADAAADLAELLTLLLAKNARKASGSREERYECGRVLGYMEELLGRGLPPLPEPDLASLRKSCYALMPGRDETSRAARRTASILDSALQRHPQSIPGP